jgi:hypothetical protein
MRVDAVAGVKVTPVADRGIDHIRRVSGVQWVHVGAHRRQQLTRRVRVHAEQRSAADDHEIVVGNRSRGPDQMFKVCTRHAASRTISTILRRSGSLSDPANGED